MCPYSYVCSSIFFSFLWRLLFGGCPGGRSGLLTAEHAGKMRCTCIKVITVSALFSMRALTSLRFFHRAHKGKSWSMKRSKHRGHKEDRHGGIGGWDGWQEIRSNKPENQLIEHTYWITGSFPPRVNILFKYKGFLFILKVGSYLSTYFLLLNMMFDHFPFTY